MKPLAPAFLFCLALTLQARSGCAQDGVPAPLAAAITQLDNDLLAVPAGSTVTDAQHQGILADLNILALGIVPAPGAADVDAIATSLGSAAAAGNVTADTLAELNTDLAADAADAADWTDDLTDDAAYLLSPDDTDPGPVVTDPGTGSDPNLPIETAVPVFVTATTTKPRRTHSARGFELGTENGQNPSNQFYDGRVEFSTRQVDGGPLEHTVYVVAVGLPQGNPYTLAVTRQSDGAVVNLGKLNVRSVSTSKFNEFLTGNTPADYHQKLENITLAKTFFGGHKLKKALPAGFDADDVASIALVDAQGITRLSGRATVADSRYAIREWSCTSTATRRPPLQPSPWPARIGPCTSAVILSPPPIYQPGTCPPIRR